MPAALEYVQDDDWERVRLNTDTTAKLLNPPVPQARVFNNANISIATSGVAQVLTFNSERWDSGSLHSTSANTGRLTASITGLWRIGCNIDFASNATGYRLVTIRLNGSTIIAADSRPATNGQDTIVPVSTEWQMVAGDYVEVTVTQTSGGALNVVAAGGYGIDFFMSRIAGYVNQGV